MGKSKRRQIKDAEWRSIRISARPYCDICGRSVDESTGTIEHIPPRCFISDAERGSIIWDKFIACVRCNADTKHLDQWIAWIAASHTSAKTNSDADSNYSMRLQQAVKNNDPEGFQALRRSPEAPILFPGSKTASIDARIWSERCALIGAKFACAYWSRRFDASLPPGHRISVVTRIYPQQFDERELKKVAASLSLSSALFDRKGNMSKRWICKFDVSEEEKIGLLWFSIHLGVQLIAFILPAELYQEFEEFRQDSFVTVDPDAGLVLHSLPPS